MPARAEPSSDLEVLETELHAGIVHRDLEEVDDARLQRGGRDPVTAEPLRVHDAVRTGPFELGDRLLGPRPGDDEQVLVERARAQGHEQRVGVVLQGGHQCLGSPDPA